MTLHLPIRDGKPLSMLLLPRENRIVFENLHGTRSIYAQALLNQKESLLIICRCSARGRDAAMLTPTAGGEGLTLEDCRIFINLLYAHMGRSLRDPCRIHSCKRVLREDSGFLFRLTDATAVDTKENNEPQWEGDYI